MEFITPCTKEELLQLTDGSLFFPKNIREAFASHPSLELQLARTDVFSFLQNLIQGGCLCYADFYYAALNSSQQKAFREALLPQEAALLAKLVLDPGRLFYPLTEETLNFFYAITRRELLFSTFYLTGMPAVLWGNYHELWPLFCRTEGEKEQYKKLLLPYCMTDH